MAAPTFDATTADIVDAAIGVAETINQNVTYTDGTTVTAVLSCTEALGDLTVGLSGSAIISVGTNGTHSFTVSGTIADVDASLGDLSYTPVAEGAATITISLDDGVNSAVPDTITITSYYMTVVATTQALLNTALATLTATNANVATETLTVLVTDDQGTPATGTNSASVVTAIPSGRTSEGMRTPDIRRSKRLVADRRLGPRQRRRV